MLLILSLHLFINTKQKQETVKIPDSAIRFRVLANSNSPKDQKIKEQVRDKMQKKLYSVLKNSKSIDSAREIINNNMTEFDNIVKEEMKDKEYSYKIDYGMHEFPKKVYKGVT